MSETTREESGENGTFDVLSYWFEKHHPEDLPFFYAFIRRYGLAALDDGSFFFGWNHASNHDVDDPSTTLFIQTPEPDARIFYARGAEQRGPAIRCYHRADDLVSFGPRGSYCWCKICTFQAAVPMP